MRYYDLTSLPRGFRLGSIKNTEDISSPFYPHAGVSSAPHTLKIEYESEPCQLAAYPGFFNIPRTGVYEITCNMTVDYIDTQALTDFSIHFVKNGTKNAHTTSGGPTDPGATVFAQQTHKAGIAYTTQLFSLNAVHKFNAGDHFSIFISAYNGFEVKGNSTPGGPRSTLVTIKEL